jgi:hypothetical protein
MAAVASLFNRARGNAWNEEGTGSEHPRTYVVEGNRLTLTTVVPRSNFFEGRPATGNEYFERED